MEINIPNVITTDALGRLAGVSRSKVLRLVASGEIRPTVHLNEGERAVPLFDPGAALIIAHLLDRNRIHDQPEVIASIH